MCICLRWEESLVSVQYTMCICLSWEESLYIFSFQKSLRHICDLLNPVITNKRVKVEDMYSSLFRFYSRRVIDKWKCQAVSRRQRTSSFSDLFILVFSLIGLFASKTVIRDSFLVFVCR